jgi:O-antigen/teichoic acid export membrane protein
MEGALVATAGIIITKILGLIYVIPFYSIIGTKGGALYSYAYSIYAIFLSLSTSGIPIAISKLMSEYNSLGFNHAEKETFKLASRIINVLGVITFLIVFIFAPQVAYLIIGNIKGGNTLDQVTIAIRLVSLSLLIVPKLSIIKGYLQGHKYITPTSISNILEQLVRVIVIVAGSFITVKIFNMPIEYAVYVAVVASAIGAIFAYVYLKLKARKINYEKTISEIKEEEKKFTSKYLLKQIIFYAMPFVITDIAKSAYGIVDTLTVVRTMVKLGYPVGMAETTNAVLSTWGTKLNMIIVSISLGITISLVPNIAGSRAKKDYKDINTKINQTLKMLLYTTLPMSVGISFLATSVWGVFYGYDALSINIFRIFILQVVFFSLYSTLMSLTQSMNETKITMVALIGGLLTNALLNIPFMYLCEFIGLKAYYGSIINSAFLQIIFIMYMLLRLKKKYQFDYSDVIKSLWKMILAIIVMLIPLWGLSFVIDINVHNRIMSLVVIAIYSAVGAITYLGISHKMKLITDVFGSNPIRRILNKFKRKQTSE